MAAVGNRVAVSAFIFAGFIVARFMAALVMETCLGRLFTERSPLWFKTNRRDFNANLGQFSGRFQAAGQRESFCNSGNGA